MLSSKFLLATAFCASAVLAARLPSTVELIYPSSGQAYTNTLVQLGLGNNKDFSGAYWYTSVGYITPDGTSHEAIALYNANLTSPSFNPSTPQECEFVNEGGAWGNVLVNQTGMYTATWNFTYGFPTKVDTSQGNTMCTGLASTESEVITKTFTVLANPEGTTNTAMEVAPTATGAGTFTVQPTGNVNSSSQKQAGVREASALWLTLSALAGITGLLMFS